MINATYASGTSSVGFDVVVTNLENQLEIIYGEQEFDNTIYNSNSSPIAVKILVSGSGPSEYQEGLLLHCHQGVLHIHSDRQPVFSRQLGASRVIPINEEEQHMCDWRFSPDKAIFPTVDFTIRCVHKFNAAMTEGMKTLVDTLYVGHEDRKAIMAKLETPKTDKEKEEHAKLTPQAIIKARMNYEDSYGCIHDLLALDLSINHCDDQAQPQMHVDQLRVYKHRPKTKNKEKPTTRNQK